LTYEPRLLGLATVHYSDAKTGVDYDEAACLLAEFPEGAVAVDWDAAETLDLAADELESSPAPGALFAAPPSAASKAKSYEAWKKSLVDHLYRSRRLELLCCDALGQCSRAGESERDFRVRLQQAAREERDRLAEKLRAKFGPKVAALEERIRKAQQAVEREQDQSRTSMWGTIASVGTTMAGAFLGRGRFTATKVGTAVRGATRIAKEESDVSRARENVEALRQQLADLEAKFQEELAAVSDKIDPLTIELTPKPIKPKKTNIAVNTIALAWTRSE
jgi:hypothetical protein